MLYYSSPVLFFYLFDDDGKLTHESFYFILDENTNENNFAYKIQTILVNI